MRYFVGFLIAIGVIILAFILIIKAFSGHGTPQQQIDLNSYATTDAVVQMTIDGPINAEQNHRQVLVTVGRSQAMVQVFEGYQGKSILTRVFPNNHDAFATFLHALSVAGFTQGNTTPGLKDERGYCPTGERFIYQIVSDGEDVQRWWRTSCGQGNFRGRSETIRNLFKQQIPGFEKLVQGTGLY